MTIAESIDIGLLRSPVPGEYVIEYSDNTHCAAGEWTPLFDVSPEFNTVPLAGSEDAQAYFSVRAILPTAASLSKQKPSEGHQRIIHDALTQCLVRTNILRPEMTPDTMVDIYRLSRSRAVVLVPDTNALSTGTLHWLLGAFAHTQVWLLPIVVSLIQVQTRDAMLKSCVNKREAKNLPKALRSRQLVNASLSLLERHRERYQVLEVDPQLLRYVRPAGNSSVDPDESDVLEDRLLLEAIHSALRATRSRAEKRVVTSDMLLARMLRAEGLPTLFLQSPTLPPGDIPCLRYEPLAKAFVGASLTDLLWELAHTFSTVRLVHNKMPIASFDTYWLGKTANDWAEERLFVSWEQAAMIAAVAPAPSAQDEGPDLRSYLDSPVLLDPIQTIPPISTPEPTDPDFKATPSEAKRRRLVFSSAPLPEVAFPQVVRLALALSSGSAPINEVVGRIPETTRPSLPIAHAAAEVLLRANFANLRDDHVLAGTQRLSELIEHLTAFDLDSASALWQVYRPYDLVIGILKRKGAIAAAETSTELGAEMNIKPAIEGADRLWRIPVYLGQAWSDEGQTLDGSSRPDAETVRDVFLRTFAQNEEDGLCSLATLLPAFCRELHCSPWFAQRTIPSLVTGDRLPEVAFQPSAGKRLSSRDQVVVIQNGEVRLQSSPIDRLDIGGRPVFTVLRGAAS
jgi:hypothetical protein